MSQLELLKEKSPNKTRHSDTNHRFAAYQVRNRNRFGITQVELAKVLGYSQGTVAHVEREKVEELNPAYVKRVRTYFNQLLKKEYMQNKINNPEPKNETVQPDPKKEEAPAEEEVQIVIGVMEECPNSNKLEDHCPHCLGEVDVRSREFVGDGWKYCTKCTRLLKYLTKDEVVEWENKVRVEKEAEDNERVFAWSSDQQPITPLQIHMWYDDMRGLIRGIYFAVWALVFTLIISQFLK